MNLRPMRTHLPTEAARTAHLTPEEFGAYEMLRRHKWVHGAIPGDPIRQARVARLSPDRWSEIAALILPLLRDEGKIA